nr:MFS transporter [Microbacterium ulmi]
MFFAGFATFAQNYDAQAVLPQLVEEYGVSPATAALTVSATTLGIAVAVLPWSHIADRVGRVRTMKVSILSASVIGLMTPLAPTFEALIALRFALGCVLAALPAIAMAYLAEEIDRAHITATASTFVAGNSIGGLIGRVLAGTIGEAYGWHAGIGAVAVLTLISGIVFVFVVPAPRGFTPAPLTVRQLTRRVIVNLANPRLRSLYVQGLLFMGAITSMYNYVGFRLQTPPLDVSPRATNYVFVVFALGAVATAVSGRFAARVGRRRVILMGHALLLVGALLTLCDGVAWVVVGLALFTIGTFSGHAMASGLVGQVAESGRAQATALYQLLSQTGSATIGWLLGVVFGAVGWGGVVFALAACAVAAALALRPLGRV